MVTANKTTGDGIARPIHYANWRPDAQEEGHSKELFSKNIDPKYYDDLEAQPCLADGDQTMLAFFKKSVSSRPDAPFLGTRKRLPDVDGKPKFGDYEWQSYQETNAMC